MKITYSRLDRRLRFTFPPSLCRVNHSRRRLEFLEDGVLKQYLKISLDDNMMHFLGDGSETSERITYATDNEEMKEKVLRCISPDHLHLVELEIGTHALYRDKVQTTLDEHYYKLDYCCGSEEMARVAGEIIEQLGHKDYIVYNTPIHSHIQINVAEGEDLQYIIDVLEVLGVEFQAIGVFPSVKKEVNVLEGMYETVEILRGKYL